MVLTRLKSGNRYVYNRNNVCVHLGYFVVHFPNYKLNIFKYHSS